MGSHQCACTADRLNEALRDYETVLSVDYEDVDALFQKGLVLQTMGRVDEAIQSLSGALTLQPNHVNASYALASCKNSKGEFKEAIRALIC